MKKYSIMDRAEQDQEMIQTPWGKKHWRTIREAFEQRDDLLSALADLLDQLDGIGIPNWHGAEGLSLEQAREAIAKAEGVE